MNVEEKGEELMRRINACNLEPKELDEGRMKELSDALYTLSESYQIENGDVEEALKIWRIVEAVTHHIGMPKELIL